jgi:hypothetical protein
LAEEDHALGVAAELLDASFMSAPMVNRSDGILVAEPLDGGALVEQARVLVRDGDAGEAKDGKAVAGARQYSCRSRPWGLT